MVEELGFSMSDLVRDRAFCLVGTHSLSSMLVVERRLKPVLRGACFECDRETARISQQPAQPIMTQALATLATTPRVWLIHFHQNLYVQLGHCPHCVLSVVCAWVACLRVVEATIMLKVTLQSVPDYAHAWRRSGRKTPTRRGYVHCRIQSTRGLQNQTRGCTLCLSVSSPCQICSFGRETLPPRSRPRPVSAFAPNTHGCYGLPLVHPYVWYPTNANRSNRTTREPNATLITDAPSRGSKTQSAGRRQCPLQNAGRQSSYRAPVGGSTRQKRL